MVVEKGSGLLKSLGKNCLLAGGVFGAAWGMDWLLKRALGTADEYDERYRVSTDDEHQIALYRYQPDRNPVGDPVLLVHGLNANHRNLALDERDGLAQYLRRQGYDCWAVELRGRVDEAAPEGSWGFDEYVNKDLPAAVDFITGETGSEAVHWIGHSMGGMAYNAYAGALGGSSDIRSGVTIGSPVFLREPVWIRVLGESYLDIPDPIRKFVDPPARTVYNWVFRAIPSRLLFLALIEKEITVYGLRVLTNTIEEGLDPAVALQFIDWIASGEWTDRHGAVDYRAGVQDIETPTMNIVSRKDRLCPDCRTAGYELLEMRDKRCIVAEDFDPEGEEIYDHISLVFGERASEKIFPEIEDWIAKYDPER